MNSVEVVLMAAEVALMPIEVRLMSDEATLIFVGVVIAVLLSTIGVEAVMLSSIGARIEVRFENPRKMLRNVLNSMLGVLFAVLLSRELS